MTKKGDFSLPRRLASGVCRLEDKPFDIRSDRAPCLDMLHLAAQHDLTDAAAIVTGAGAYRLDDRLTVARVRRT